MKIKHFSVNNDFVFIVTNEDRIFYCDMGEIESAKKWYELGIPDLEHEFPADINNRIIFAPRKKPEAQT